MKKTYNIKRGLKVLASSVLALGFSLVTLNSVLAWGPERATFTMEKPATYPTFNSITDNPTIGDERDFVRVGEINADVTDLRNEVEVVPGRQYLVYIYFHNNASATYNDSAHNNSGVALMSTMATNFSTILTPSERGAITATITANNANPKSVWDEAYMTTKSEKVLMRYVSGSAKIYNDWGANGAVMPSSLFTKEGTLIGLNTLNGVVPGCEEYHGVVSYVLQAEERGGGVEKTVSKDGQEYTKNVSIKPDEEVYFQLAIVNTGDVAITNTTIKDSLPEGLTLVPGSVGLRANDSTTIDPLSDNILDTGYNLGTVGTGNTVYITYKAKAGADFDCTGSELVNKATLTYDSEDSSGETREDSATVIVKGDDCKDQDCVTNPEMEECQELPSTGPLEIAMAAIIIAGIGGGGYYFYRTRKTLNKVEGAAKGDDTPKENSDTSKDTK